MSLMQDVGTIEWARRTNGVLGRGEKARFYAATLLTLGRIGPGMIAARAGRRGSGPDPSALTPPDTPFTRDLLEACGDLDPMIIEHGYRSYLYARALGIAEGISVDDEALFAATVLHDYAFETMGSLRGECFTLAGAKVAQELLAASPLGADAQHDVLDAICLHLNPSVPATQGELQHLVHDGVLVDVLGVRAWHLDHDGVRRVADQHPRHGFTVRGTPLLRGHGRSVPGCRAQALFRTGFGPALLIGPWHGADKEHPAD